MQPALFILESWQPSSLIYNVLNISLLDMVSEYSVYCYDCFDAAVSYDTAIVMYISASVNCVHIII